MLWHALIYVARANQLLGWINAARVQ